MGCCGSKARKIVEVVKKPKPFSAIACGPSGIASEDDARRIPEMSRIGGNMFVLSRRLANPVDGSEETRNQAAFDHIARWLVSQGFFVVIDNFGFRADQAQATALWFKHCHNLMGDRIVFALTGDDFGSTEHRGHHMDAIITACRHESIQFPVDKIPTGPAIASQKLPDYANAWAYFGSNPLVTGIAPECYHGGPTCWSDSPMYWLPATMAPAGLWAWLKQRKATNLGRRRTQFRVNPETVQEEAMITERIIFDSFLAKMPGAKVMPFINMFTDWNLPDEVQYQNAWSTYEGCKRDFPDQTQGFIFFHWDIIDHAEHSKGGPLSKNPNYQRAARDIAQDMGAFRPVDKGPWG